MIAPILDIVQLIAIGKIERFKLKGRRVLDRLRRD
jgi:hypothetical protein